MASLSSVPSGPGRDERGLSTTCSAKLIPVPAGRINRRPVGTDPFVENSEGQIEGPAEFRQLVEGGGLDATRIETAGDEPVTLRSAERVSQNLIGDAVQSIMKVLVAATCLSELG